MEGLNHLDHICDARAMGEFGAVSVVSGHIRGLTNMLPLHVEILYNEYQFAGAIAAASLLCLMARGTLVAKKAVERKLALAPQMVGSEVGIYRGPTR
jgi:sulfate transport system permease protein